MLLDLLNLHLDLHLKATPRVNLDFLIMVTVATLNVTFVEEQDVEDSLREHLTVAEVQLLQVDFLVMTM